MKHWITTDTHFNHVEQMMDYAKRPKDYEERILSGFKRLKANDVLIHLGDICIGEDVKWHNELSTFPFKKWLVRGNHDNQSISWYMEHGWDFVADRIWFKMFGKEILFSHFPIADCGYDVNIHGHFHNTTNREREPQFLGIMNNKHRLIAVENLEYKPISLEKVVGTL